MSVTLLLKAADRDSEGVENTLRIIGSRDAPAKMVIQIAIVGTAAVQIQGRIARDAPWQNLGPAHTASTLFHIDAVQFLRAIASNVAAKSSVTVWAVWAW
jgi:hypothetical protein